MSEQLDRYRIYNEWLKDAAVNGGNPDKARYQSDKPSSLNVECTKSIKTLIDAMHSVTDHPMVSKHHSNDAFPRVNIEKFMTLNQMDDKSNPYSMDYKNPLVVVVPR